MDTDGYFDTLTTLTVFQVTVQGFRLDSVLMQTMTLRKSFDFSGLSSHA